jgi:hypothetical protein
MPIPILPLDKMSEARVASGEAKFVDWEKAKEEIRRQNS